MNEKHTIIKAANQIVTDHLIKRFLGEVDFFYQIVEHGEQLIVFTNNKSLCVIDVSDNKDPASLIEKFCFLFADKNNILCDVRVEESETLETLVLTLQNGEVYYIQDFSKLYLKL
jgi:hypothetical protein